MYWNSREEAVKGIETYFGLKLVPFTQTGKRTYKYHIISPSGVIMMEVTIFGENEDWSIGGWGTVNHSNIPSQPPVNHSNIPSQPPFAFNDIMLVVTDNTVSSFVVKKEKITVPLYYGPEKEIEVNVSDIQTITDVYLDTGIVAVIVLKNGKRHVLDESPIEFEKRLRE